MRGQIAEGKWFNPLLGETKTLSDLFKRYMVEHSAVNKAGSSHIRDRSSLKNILRVIGDPVITRISAKDISHFKNARIKEAAPATVNKELNMLSHAFNVAIKEWEWMDKNPVSQVSRAKDRPFKERWLTLEEEECLITHSPSWLAQMIVFATNTGLRCSEVLGLEWKQIDLFRRTLTLYEQKNRTISMLPYR